MNLLAKTVAVLAPAATLLGLAAVPATADPQKGFTVAVACDDGSDYTVIARAAQAWNAQLDTDSNSAFHLVWYEITFEVTEPDGTVTVFGPDEVVKGGNDRTHKDLLSCTFAFDVVFEDGATAHISGPLLGWLTPSGGD